MTLDARVPAILDINLLPAERRPAGISGRAVAVAAAFALAIAGLVPLSLYAQAAEERADAAERRAENAEAVLRTLQVDLTQQRAVRIETEQAEANAAVLRETRAAMQQGARPLHDDLSMLWGWGFLPPGSEITRITGTARTFKVEGVAASPLDAIAYAEALAERGGFAGASLTSFTPSGDEGAFVVDVQR